MNEFITCIKKYATFEGRASRREYWMFVLFYWVVCIILGIFSFTLVKITGIDSISAVLSGIFALSMLLPTIAVGARRLHDVNKSGWYLLIALIPLGIFYILWLACITGDDGENMYGPAPVTNSTSNDMSADNSASANSTNINVNNANTVEAPKIIDTPNIIDTNSSNQ